MIIKDARDENNIKYYFGLKVDAAWINTVQFIGRTRDLSFSNLVWIEGKNSTQTGDGTNFPTGITVERGCDVLEWDVVKAQTLTNARTFRTNLASTSTASFDGSASVTPGVTGTLPIGNGGTGQTTAQNVVCETIQSGIVDKAIATTDVSDTTEIITTHATSGYTSSTKDLYRRPATKLWNYIKDKISSVLGLSTTGYTGNAATASAAKSGSALETAINGKAPTNHASSSDTYGKGTTSNYGHVKLATGDMNGASNTDGEACSKNHTHSQYLTSHQDISGKMATDCSNKASGALQNLTSQLTQGTDPFTDGTEIFSSYADDNGFATTGHVNQPYRRKASAMWSYIKSKLGISSGKGGSDTPVYFNSDGQATTCNEMLRKNGGNATDTCMNALLMALPTNWTATPTDDTYLVRRDTGGAQSFGQVKFSTVWSYIYNKLFYAKNPADSSQTTHKRIQLGYAAVGGSNVGFCCYLVHIFFNYVDGNLKGCGVTALVTLDWRTSESRLAKLCIVNDNGMSAAGYNIVLANFLTDSGANLHITIGLVKKSASTTLVEFSYSYCRIVPISNGMNWTHSVASDTVDTYDFLIQGTYENAGNADSVDGYHIQVGSYSSRTDTISLY